MRIAIVEDDDEIRTLLSLMLTQKLEYPPPTLFSNGTSLIKALSDSNLNFDAIIMDYRMPEMNGIEAAKIIKRHRSGMRIILVTGYDMKDEANRSGLLYLQKPFSIAALTRILGHDAPTV